MGRCVERDRSIERAVGGVRRFAECVGVVAATVSLVVSWGFLLQGYEMVAGPLLAPWTHPWPAFPRPAAGTCERTLNDFFARAPGLYLPAGLVVGGSMVLFLSGMARARLRIVPPLAFLGSNVLFSLLLIAIYALMVPLTRRLPDLWLPQPRPEPDVGYHRTWPELLLHAVLAALLLWSQSRLRLLGAGRPAPAGHGKE